MSYRRSVVVAAETLAELVQLAGAAVAYHDLQTHYGECDVCRLVDKWRARLRQPDNVDGLVLEGNRRNARKGVRRSHRRR